MLQLKISVILALLIITTRQQNNVCLRNKYIGGPQNTIIKGEELLDSLLQYSNVSTTLLYFGTRSSINALTGESTNYYVFTIQDTSNAVITQRILIMAITSFQATTFVDSFILVAFDGTAASVTYINALITAAGFSFSFANVTFLTSGAFFAAPANAVPCNLNKEYYTYFYQLFGNKFKSKVNNTF